MKKNKKVGIILVASLTIGGFSPLWAQEDALKSETKAFENETEEMAVVIPPLFEYVEAPEDIVDLQSKTDYLMEHFWDPFDFKNTTVVDQNALNHAFEVYVTAMSFASEKKIDDSVKKLIENIKNNPVLSYQFAKAAEEKLYGPRAELQGDAIYMKFLMNVIDNKKIKESQKRRYIKQLELLQRSSVGSILPSIPVVDLEGTATEFVPSKEFTLLEFTTPSCEDGPYSNLKMDISGTLNDLIEEDRLQIAIIVTDDKTPQGNFPSKWNIYYSPSAAEIIDIKLSPSFYVVDGDKKIVGKNLPIDNAISLIEALSTLK